MGGGGLNLLALQSGTEAGSTIPKGPKSPALAYRTPTSGVPITGTAFTDLLLAPNLYGFSSFSVTVGNTTTATLSGSTFTTAATLIYWIISRTVIDRTIAYGYISPYQNVEHSFTKPVDSILIRVALNCAATSLLVAANVFGEIIVLA